MMLAGQPKLITFVVALILCGLGGCGSSSSDSNAEGGSPTAVSEDPTPTEDAPVVAEPKTEIVSCKIEEGLPVAEVKVTNSTDATGAFGVSVQFASGSTVLGEGYELTSSLEPGQDETIRMGNMQGDAAAVDTCKVTEASLSE